MIYDLTDLDCLHSLAIWYAIGMAGICSWHALWLRKSLMISCGWFCSIMVSPDSLWGIYSHCSIYACWAVFSKLCKVILKGCCWITQRRRDSWLPEEKNSIQGCRWGLIAQSFCVIKFYQSIKEIEKASDIGIRRRQKEYPPASLQLDVI